MHDSIREELKAGRTVLLNTTGRSMRPLLTQGRTQVLICPGPYCPRRGDLPLVEVRPGLYRLHRIIRLRQDGSFLTRGDNSILKETVQPSQVLGLATQIRRGKRVISLSGPGCRAYWRIWLLLTPVRIPIYHLRGSLESLKERRTSHG